MTVNSEALCVGVCMKGYLYYYSKLDGIAQNGRGHTCTMHCKNKKVALTNLGYLSCIFTTKQCAYKQIN